MRVNNLKDLDKRIIRHRSFALDFFRGKTIILSLFRSGVLGTSKSFKSIFHLALVSMQMWNFLKIADSWFYTKSARKRSRSSSWNFQKKWSTLSLHLSTFFWESTKTKGPIWWQRAISTKMPKLDSLSPRTPLRCLPNKSSSYTTLPFSTNIQFWL